MERSRRRRLLLLLFPALTAVATPAHAAAPFTFTKVALQGEAAPGTEPGTVFAPLDDIYTTTFPALDGSGAISFVAILEGPAVTSSNRTGLWSWSAGSLARVVRAGDVAPERPPGSRFASFPLDFALAPPAAGGGRLAFGATLSGGGADFMSDDGLWVVEGGAPRLVAGEGDSAPGFPADVRLGAPAGFELDRGGNAFLACPLRGPGITADNDEAFWSDRGDALAIVLREGQAAPGLPPGVVVGGAGEFIGTGYTFGSVAWSTDSRLALQASVTGPGVTTFDNEAVFAEVSGPGTLARIAREGDPAPGGGEFGGNSVLADFAGLSVNRLGHVSFTARVHVSGNTVYGLWSTHRGPLAVLARPGLPAPGADDEFGFISIARLSDGGRIAFGATLFGDSPPYLSGLWWDPSGTLVPVFLPGDSAPGRPGSTLTGLQAIHAFDAAGRLAFSAVLDEGARTALYQADAATGTVHEVLATGDQFDVQGSAGPGSDLAPVETIRFGAMNEGGAMALRLDFADGRFGVYGVTRGGTTAVLPPATPASGPGLALAGGVPNPFTTGTRLALTLPAAAHVSLRIHDAAGRLVRTLLDEPRGGGTHAVEWDGRDNRGARRTAGVYRARLRAGDAERSVALVLLPGRR